MDIGKGDWVECVDVGASAFTKPLTRIHLHGLYEVEWTGHSKSGLAVGTPILRLVGISMNPGKRGYMASRFRHVYRPKDSLIESLKAPARLETLIGASHEP